MMEKHEEKEEEEALLLFRDTTDEIAPVSSREQTSYQDIKCDTQARGVRVCV